VMFTHSPALLTRLTTMLSRIMSLKLLPFPPMR